MSNHFMVVERDYQTSIYGVFGTLPDAREYCAMVRAEHPSNEKYFRPSIEEWDGAEVVAEHDSIETMQLT